MFVIFCGSRSGSHLLKSLLNSHPNLAMHDEILGLRKDHANFFDLGPNTGCLVSYRNLIEGNEYAKGNDIPRIVERMNEIPVIHLTRDPVDRAKSQLYYSQAKSRDKSAWREANLIRNTAQVKVEIKQEDIDRLASAFVQHKVEAMRLFPDRSSWLNIDYDWLTEGKEVKELPARKGRMICTFLKQKYAPLTCHDYRKARKDSA
jgi:hypothetical protein